MSADSGAPDRLALTDPEVLKCPYEYYAQVHAHGAAARDEGPIGWIIGGWKDVHEYTRDKSRFSADLFQGQGTKLTGASPEPPLSEDVQALVDQMEPMASALVIADPPQHTRQKAIASKCLNATRIAAMEPFMHEVINRQIDTWIGEGRCEFVSQFAIPVPVTLIANALGVDAPDMARFKKWTDHLEQGYLEALDNTQRLAVAQSVLEFQEYMLEQMADRRANPTDDLLSALVNTRVEAGDAELEGEELEGPPQLTDSEILTCTSQLLAAGNITTTSLMANLMVALIENPDAMEAVRADRSLVDTAIDESLRRDSPVRCGYRFTPQDADLRGTTVPAGSQVFFSFGATGHDPAVYPEPATFDINRPNLKRHLGFGYGPHFCVGSQLARTQTRIAFETLLERVADIGFAGGERPEPMISLALSGYHEVQLEFATP